MRYSRSYTLHFSFDNIAQGEFFEAMISAMPGVTLTDHGLDSLEAIKLNLVRLIKSARNNLENLGGSEEEFDKEHGK